MVIFVCSCATFSRTDGDIVQNSAGEEFSDTYQYTQAKLSKETLKTFEPVALEQFNEFFEQVKIAVNPDYAENFRTEARNALKGTLITANHQYDSVLTGTDEALEKYLSALSGDTLYNRSLKKSRMKLPFRQNGEHVYRGQISFRIEGEKNPKTIDTYLVRVLKSFGTEEEEIWEVRFDPF